MPVKLMGPKDVGWRVFYVLACIWGIAIAARLAMDAVARIWPLVIVAAVLAVVWVVVIGRRQ